MNYARAIRFAYLDLSPVYILYGDWAIEVCTFDDRPTSTLIHSLREDFLRLAKDIQNELRQNV